MQCRKCSVQQADQKLLARLAEQEAQDQHIQSARREKARADAAWMKKVLTVWICLLLKTCFTFSALTLSVWHQDGCLASKKYLSSSPWGLASESWWEAWRPSPKMDPGAFSGQRVCLSLWQCTASECSSSALLGDLLEVSRSMERDLLSVLLIYPRIFLRVFIAYHLLIGFLYVWLYSAVRSCVLVVLVKLSVLAKWLAIERPLWWHLLEVRRLSPQSPGGRVCLCVFFFRLVCLCCYVFPPALHSIYFIRLWYNIAYMCISSVKHQTNKQCLWVFS